MSEKWLSALRQGKSGGAATEGMQPRVVLSYAHAQEGLVGGIQLKRDVVELIPELTY
jgi:hypothetical protein